MSLVLLSLSFELHGLAALVELEFNIFLRIILDQGVKSLCNIWHPQDIPNTFFMLSHAMVAGA